MKTRTFRRKLITGLLALSMTFGMAGTLPYRVALADWGDDIDSVMQGLDSDFTFGGKEDFKRSQKQSVNEQLREDNSITQSTSSGLVDVKFFVKEYFADGTTLSVDVVGEQAIASGVDGSTATGSVPLKPGSIHTFKLTCTGINSCEFWIFIIKGALFNPSQLDNTGSIPLFIGGGNMTTFQFNVSADNSASDKPVPAPPPPTAM